MPRIIQFALKLSFGGAAKPRDKAREDYVSAPLQRLRAIASLRWRRAKFPAARKRQPEKTSGLQNWLGSESNRLLQVGKPHRPVLQ